MGLVGVFIHSKEKVHLPSTWHDDLLIEFELRFVTLFTVS